MKILHVIGTADPKSGGPIEGVLRLGEAYRARGHTQELLTLDRPDAPWLGDSASPIHAMGRRPSSLPGPLGKAARWANRSPAAVRWLQSNRDQFDGIVVDGLWNYATRAARSVLPGGSTPYIAFSHGMLDPYFRTHHPLKHALKSVLWRFNEGPLLRGAQVLAFTCEGERVHARGTWRPWGMREQVLGYGTSPPPRETEQARAAFRAAVPGLQDKDYLLFLGRLSEIKGCDILIRAFGEVAEEHPGVHLVVAGPAAEPYGGKLRQLAERSGFADRIHFPGMIGGDAKWGAIYGCRALVLPSHHENFGVVVAEAGACGRPVIVSDQVKIHNEIFAAGAGLVCETNTASVTAILRSFLDLPKDGQEAMGERGRRLFEERFTISGVADRILEIFENSGKSA